MKKQGSRVHKYCKLHGKRYLLHEDFSLCAFPDCFDSAVYSILKNVPLFNKLQEFDVKDDFRSFLSCKLLKECKEDEKVIALNRQWLIYSMYDFFNMEMKKGAIPMESIPKTEKNNRTYAALSQEIMEEIDDISSSIHHMGQSSEKKYLFEEMKHSIEKLVGKNMLLLLLEEINIQDFARLESISMKKTKDLRKEAIELIRKEVIE